MLRKTHERLYDEQAKRWINVCNILKEEIEKRNVDLALAKKDNDRLQDIKILITEKEKEILWARAKREYIYSVTFGKFDDILYREATVYISILSTNYDLDAKREALKQWNLPLKEVKNCKAVRWVI